MAAQGTIANYDPRSIGSAAAGGVGCAGCCRDAGGRVYSGLDGRSDFGLRGGDGAKRAGVSWAGDRSHPAGPQPVHRR